MKKLIIQNYNAVVKRGKITPNTTNEDFYDKLTEEDNELLIELFKNQNDMSKKTLNDRQAEELTDIINTCINWLIYSGRDVEDELNKVRIKNEKRANNDNTTRNDKQD